MNKRKLLGYTGRALMLFGFFIIIGGVGRVDMAIELQEKLSGFQEMCAYLISVSGFGVGFIGYKLMQKFDDMDFDM